MIEGEEDLLHLVQALSSVKGKATEDLTPHEIMSMNLAQEAKNLKAVIAVSTDAGDVVEMLNESHRSLQQKDETKAIKFMDKLADENNAKSLFSSKNIDELKNFLETLNDCCFQVNQSLKQVITKAVTQKEFASELDTEFAQSAAKLQSTLSKELCGAYGDKVFMIIEHKAKATNKKGEDMTDSEYTSIVNSYESAVEDKDKLDQILYQAFINMSEHI